MDNSKRVIHFAVEENDFVLVADVLEADKLKSTRSTELDRKEVHKGTWTPSDKKTINQID